MRLCAIAVMVGLVAAAVPAGAQVYFELMGSPVRDAVPPDCSDWHELNPNFCVVHHQEGYEDDGDGEVSVCDYITLSGIRYHIEYVGPTYVLSGPDMMWCEPTDPEPGGNPECEIWHEVAPDFCAEWHVDLWEDNGDGILSECDVVWIAGEPWHIDAINLDIIGIPMTPVEDGTWSRIKRFFGELFGG